MGCRHEGFHQVRSRYDRERGMLIFFWTCEVCGTRLSEFRREAYRPHYDPGATTASELRTPVCVENSKNSRQPSGG